MLKLKQLLLLVVAIMTLSFSEAQEIKGKGQDELGKFKQRSDPNPGVDDA